MTRHLGHESVPGRCKIRGDLLINVKFTCQLVIRERAKNFGSSRKTLEVVETCRAWKMKRVVPGTTKLKNLRLDSLVVLVFIYRSL